MEEELKKEIDELTRKLEKLQRDFFEHIHNGFGSSKILLKDITDVLFKQATINPVNLVDGAGETLQVTGVTGATLGDFVLVSAPYDLQDISVTAYVQANDIVEIRLQNESGNTVNLASGIWRVLVLKKIV